MKPVQNTSLFETIDTLRQDGFTIVFRLENDRLVCPAGTFNIKDFDIVQVYRCRDDSDQAREATVYAIRAGLSGLLIMGSNSSNTPIPHRIRISMNRSLKTAIGASLKRFYLTCKQALSSVKLPKSLLAN